MSSKSSSDGRYVLTCTFKVGSNLDLANVDINNRVNKATAKLPKEAVAAGISVKKKSPDILLAISVYSPDSTFDETFLSNFTSINLVDPIARTPGVGSTMIVGQRDYAMRFWVRPDKLAKLGLTGTDLANVINEQNLVAPAGQVGQPPAKAGTQFQYTVNVKGRLTDPSEFENMIVRTLPDGSILRMKDVSRAELSGKSYTSFGRKDGIPATVLIIYQLPGANAIQTVDNVRKLLDDSSKTFPPGLKYRISLDTTEFVKVAIHEVFHALRDAIILVLIVVFIFLGNIRATFIPMLAVPVSLVGTFAAFAVLGFSINTLTMLAVVLAVGIVVDDAIVVVEAVEHHIEHGLSPLEATEKAMDEVSGPVMAIGLVLCAVFVPVSFMGGIVGQLYRQFAITISISVILSVIVALTLTPALCRMMLRPRKQMRGPVGAFLRGFNKVFNKTTGGYLGGVGFFLRRVAIGLACLAGLWFGAGRLLMKLPTGFVPNEDQGYFFSVFTLPDGASMERTDQLMKRAEADLKEHSRCGRSPHHGRAQPSDQRLHVEQRFDHRHAQAVGRKEERGGAAQGHSAGRPNRSSPLIRKRISLVFPPPPINGLGNASGFVFELQDKVGPHAAGTRGGERQVHAGHGESPGTDRHLLRLQHLHSANQAGHRSRQGAHLEYSRQQRVPGAADLSGRPPGQRLQSIRPNLQSHASGGTGLPQIAGEHQRHLHTLQRQLHGADVHRQHDQHDDRAGHPAALQHVPDARRSTARTRPAFRPDRPSTSWKNWPQGTSPRIRLRMDQHRLSGEGSRRHARTDFRYGHGLRVSGAGGAVRELGRAVLRAARAADRRFRRISRSQGWSVWRTTCTSRSASWR